MKQAQMAIVSFTPGGKQLAERIVKQLLKPLGDCMWQALCAYKPSPLQEWCRREFSEKDALIFIGAMGIAVRTIAPFLQSKTTDPAVLVLDEQGRHVISLLSGHLGGGNELARRIARCLGAEPVITTASDVNDKIAVDVFAKRNGLFISSMEMAKKAAAAIVAEEPVSFACEGAVKGRLPRELSAKQGTGIFHIAVTPYETEEASLWLVPRAFVLGLGCRKGKTLEEIEAFVLGELAKRGISIHSIQAAATIDLKRQEQGLLDFCMKYSMPLSFYSGPQLLEAPGSYQPSEFVRSVTGVDNVCERAAMRRAWEENPHIEKENSLIIEKCKKDGVTMALAKRDWSVEFE